MPIDPDRAIGATLGERTFSWNASDVLLYHLALGAGADPVDPGELRYAYEADLQVLPTFGVVAPTLRDTEPPRVEMPGIEIDLAAVLHGSQEISLHGPLPTSGEAVARGRIVDVQDKGSAAVIVQETAVEDTSGRPLWTTQSSIFVRGEGGFGGDRNPLHADPGFAAGAGFDRPILHGLCTYGMVCKAVVDGLLDGDASRVDRFSARFAGVVFPGETLRTQVWSVDERLVLATSVVEREAPVLADAVCTSTA